MFLTPMQSRNRHSDSTRKLWRNGLQILYVFVAMVGTTTVPGVPRWGIWRSLFAPRPRHYFLSRAHEALNGFGLKVLKTPVRSPMANAYCERVIGTIRRESLDYLIPINDRHLSRIVREFAPHYNRGRPHTALRPGFPEPNPSTIGPDAEAR